VYQLRALVATPAQIIFTRIFIVVLKKPIRLPLPREAGHEVQRFIYMNSEERPTASPSTKVNK